jgi:ADP-ribose pyrophosphatase YjhB (NUDIX family)
VKSGPDPFDLVREWFAAYNRGDLDAIDVFYEPTASLEQDNGLVQGRDGIRSVLAKHFAQWDPGFEGGIRRRVRMIGRIESGSIHAEWAEREVRGQSVRERRGYSDFVVEGGHIHTQREVAHSFPVDGDEPVTAPEQPVPSRVYPQRPVVGVGAVIVHEGSVVLIKRKFEPLAGQWSLPGGTLELGESLEAGIAREMREETGLEVEVGPVIEVFDRILLDTEGRVRYHFVLIDYLCRPIGGQLVAGSDVADAVLVEPTSLGMYRMTPKAVSVIERALAMVPEAFSTSGVTNR